ncbi:putative Down syndrome cell adhesion molecule-like protein 2-like 16 [Homarus americanus]|uniref:Putative Down syndrome cell adhesion molecule-like protein 2-like 16 n=1 Tax=Homarus americanus TaxID=6706 RepID=A0A8J5J9H2_HOMAM|nr:putative Down syndrome cell adhesion molecule-like protein 2-like 16 [Homarus americanus]
MRTFRVQPDWDAHLGRHTEKRRGHYSCTATNHHGSDAVTYNLIRASASVSTLHVTETTASSIRVQSVEDTAA